MAAGVAQSPRTITARADNDAFDFWRQPGDRPDEEYTSGVRLVIDGGAAPKWARLLGVRFSACVTGSRECASATREFGQDIYSPRRTGDDPVAPSGSRPNAGWLFGSETARILRERRSDEYTITLGVTGQPSLAQQTQTLAHAMAPSFNRPTDWRHQIGFEPGVIGRYVHTGRISIGPAVDVLPRAGVALGNVRTDAEAGVRVRAGFNLRHPWLPSAEHAPPEVAFMIGAAGAAVARDLFLDGNTFHASEHVGHETFVYSREWSLTVRRDPFTLSYGAVTESRAYASGPGAHTWATMSAGITLRR